MVTQHVDATLLSEIAEEFDFDIFIVAIAGKLVAPNTPLAWVDGEVHDNVYERIASAFTIDSVRSFDQDPRFGAAVLSEIASRALSPAINDPGTAIDVISRAIRVLSVWDSQDSKIKVVYPRLFVTPIRLEDLFDDLFVPIARDGHPSSKLGFDYKKRFLPYRNSAMWSSRRLQCCTRQALSSALKQLQ